MARKETYYLQMAYGWIIINLLKAAISLFDILNILYRH